MLLKKFFNVGFEAIEAHDRRPFGLDELRRYPLFTGEFLDFLRQTLPPARHGEVVWSVVVTAQKPRLRTTPRLRHPNERGERRLPGRGVLSRSFDGRGNYTMGVTEHIVFREIDYDKVEKIRGLDITIVTSARTDEEGRELLRLMNMPFRVR